MKRRRPGRRALRILAKSLYREMKKQGFDAAQIVDLASELIAHIHRDLAEASS